EDDRADYQVFNVGGGRAVTVMEIAFLMLSAFRSGLEPIIPGEFRLGDTRHTVSDISRLRALGWEPGIPVEQNIAEYAEWIGEQAGKREYLEQAARVRRENCLLLHVDRCPGAGHSSVHHRGRPGPRRGGRPAVRGGGSH